MQVTKIVSMVLFDSNATHVINSAWVAALHACCCARTFACCQCMAMECHAGLLTPVVPLLTYAAQAGLQGAAQ
jgi:hypothetical protein